MLYLNIILNEWEKIHNNVQKLQSFNPQIFYEVY